MRAIVVEEPNKISLSEVPTPEPGPDDVLVHSRMAGLCRTDLEILHGLVPSKWIRYPCIPGHEWSGTVAAVGSNVGGFEVGDRVVSEGMIPCNRCRRCKNGETNLCENYDQLGFTRGGGCGEFVLAPQHVVHRLADHVSFEAGVLVEPASCVLLAMERARPSEGEAIGVVGIGTLGSIAVQLARLFGPRAIVAYGIRDEELELARRMGATHTINPRTSDPERQTIDLLGDGLDLVVESAGSPDAVRMAMNLIRTGGRVALLGVAGGDTTLEILSDYFVIKDATAVGAFSYTTRIWSKVLDLVDNRLVDFDPIVTHRFGIEAFQDAYHLMDDRSGIVAKMVLEHAGA